MADAQIVVVDNAKGSRPIWLYGIHDGNRIGQIDAGLMGSQESGFVKIGEENQEIDGFWLRKTSLRPKEVLGGGVFCFVQTGQNLLGQMLILAPQRAYCLGSNSALSALP
jgi:hypothetical protein